MTPQIFISIGCSGLRVVNSGEQNHLDTLPLLNYWTKFNDKTITIGGDTFDVYRYTPIDPDTEMSLNVDGGISFEDTTVASIEYTLANDSFQARFDGITYVGVNETMVGILNKINTKSNEISALRGLYVEGSIDNEDAIDNNIPDGTIILERTGTSESYTYTLKIVNIVNGLPTVQDYTGTIASGTTFSYSNDPVNIGEQGTAGVFTYNGDNLECYNRG